MKAFSAIGVSLSTVVFNLFLINTLVALGYLAYELTLRNAPFAFILLFTFLPYATVLLLLPGRDVLFSTWSQGHTFAAQIAILQLIYWSAFWKGLQGENSAIILSILSLEIVLIPLSSSLFYNVNLHKRWLFYTLSLLTVIGVVLTKLHSRLTEIGTALFNTVTGVSGWSLLFICIALTARVITEVYKANTLNSPQKLTLVDRNGQNREFTPNDLITCYYPFCAIVCFLIFLVAVAGNHHIVRAISIYDLIAMCYISVAPAGISALIIAKLQSENVPGEVIFSCGAARPVIFVTLVAVLVVITRGIGWDYLADRLSRTLPEMNETLVLGLTIVTVMMLGFIGYHVSLYRDRRQLVVYRGDGENVTRP